MSEAEICFSSAQVEGVYSPAGGDLLLVTFGTVHSLANGGSFWGETFVKKVGISTLGFMAKSANWYPVNDMDEASRALRPILAQYSQIVTYGTSMGAYGALKHAKRLGAGAAIAFAPQFSINPADIAGIDDRYHRYYRPDTRGGEAVTAEDLAESSVIFFDPYYREDTYNTRMITKLSTGVTALRTPMMQHFPIDLFAGTESGQLLVRSVVGRDFDSLRRHIRSRRRANVMRIMFVIEKASMRNLALATDLLDRYGHRIDLPQTIWLLSRLGKLAVQVGEWKTAEQLYERALALDQHHVEALIGMQTAKSKQGKYDEAATWGLRAVKAAPSGITYNTLGGVLLALGRLEEAYNAVKMALRLQPGCSDFMRRLSAIKERQGDFVVSVKWALEAVRTDPTSAPACALLASVCEQHPNVPNVVKALKVAKALAPEDERLEAAMRSVVKSRL